MSTVGKLVVRIGADVGPLEQALNTASSRLKSFGSSMKSTGTALTLGISAPIAGIATMALRSAADFEQSMNLMQSMSGATEAQMASLEQQALDLGASTSFSAGEAAAAMLELSKAGMSVEQTSAAIGGVMDLAAAGGIDLAEAATITANAINTFGLEASEATNVANTFAAAANASSADVGDLAQGFAMAGAVFAANGQSVDDLAASLAILANNGIAGSDAGTSLKTMMMRLASPTAEAAAEMDKLGLKIYDSTGAMVPFGDIVRQLEESTAGLSDEQRNAALSTIFGADAIRAATILANEGGASYDKMSEAVKAQGAASDIANARMKGLGGAIEYFKGSIDSLLIGAAMPFMETLGNMVRKAADLLSGIGNLSPEMQKWGAIIAVVAAAAGPLLIALGALSTALGALLSPVGLVVVAVAALGVAWATNWGGIQEKTAAVWAVVQPYFAQAVTWFQTTIPAALTALQGWFTKAWTAVQGAVSTAWGVVQPLLVQAGAWLGTNLPGALTTMQGWFATAWTAAQAAVSTAWGVVGPLLTQLGAWLSITIPAVLAVLQGLFGTAWTAIATSVSDATGRVGPLLETLGTTLSGLWTTLQSLWDTVSTFLAPAIERVGAAFGTLGTQAGTMGPVMTELKGSLETALTALGEAFTAMWAVVQPILTVMGATLGVIIDFGINLLASSVENMSAIVTPIFEVISSTIGTLGTILSETVTLIKAIIDGDWTTAWQSSQDIVAALGAFVLDTFQAIYDFVAAIVITLKDAVVGTLTDLGVDMQGIMDNISGWWEEKWAALEEFVQPAIDAVNTVLDTLQGVWDWLKTHVFVNPFEGWDLNPFNNGATAGNADGGLNLPGANAAGTSYWKGGLTWVGEQGPELVNLPVGTRIWSNADSLAMAAGGGGQVTFNVTVNQDLDWEELRWKLNELTRRRG